MLFGSLVTGVVLGFPMAAQAPAPVQTAKVTGSPYRYEPNHLSKRANVYYSVIWGIDSLDVKSVESGELIRFSYRVLDPNKAQTLNDPKAEPSLIDVGAKVRLVVPSLEKVGQLRQKSSPIAGKNYWMAFSNKGRLVKPGDRVSVIIGQFRADGLVVK
jgi:hypothetical protein